MRRGRAGDFASAAEIAVDNRDHLTLLNACFVKVLVITAQNEATVLANADNAMQNEGAACASVENKTAALKLLRR